VRKRRGSGIPELLQVLGKVGGCGVSLCFELVEGNGVPVDEVVVPSGDAELYVRKIVGDESFDAAVQFGTHPIEGIVVGQRGKTLVRFCEQSVVDALRSFFALVRSALNFLKMAGLRPRDGHHRHRCLRRHRSTRRLWLRRRVGRSRRRERGGRPSSTTRPAD
jgi:hypothetical protein